MALNTADFQKLKTAFDTAANRKLLLYDIMTERYEITSAIQRELALTPAIFGTLTQGTEAQPAVENESVHYFFKSVSGKPLIRPTWFFDVTQQGEGLADVSTHLVDLVQWQCFPDQALDYAKDIQVLTAKHWATEIPLSNFKAVTQSDAFPDFLKPHITKDSILQVFSNGTIQYTIKGVQIKTTVAWNYQAPPGSGDTYACTMRGTKANLIIQQGPTEKYKPTLYIEPINDPKDLTTAFAPIAQKYPGAQLEQVGKRWKVVLPEKYTEGHEAHFGRVTEKFLGYLKNGNIPTWEVPNMLSKYFITTKAVEMAH